MCSDSLVRIGVDIGGTFTDVALEIGEKQHTVKVLTTVEAPERGVISAINQVLHETSVSSASVGIVIHGTTLATNAIIERKGARTALLTTEGFRDIVEIRHESRFDQYDLDIELPKPLVPRYLRLPIMERVNAQGGVLVPLCESDVENAIKLMRASEVESVAVGYLHSFMNSTHEERTAEILKEKMPDVGISLSCEVSPEMREYERLSTACANAYVQPLMSEYLGKLANGLKTHGIEAPLFLMSSGGGITTVETARRFPVRLVESGPAGGAIFACGIANVYDLDEVLSFDMGGTTAKVCLIDKGNAQVGRALEVARVYRFKKGSGLPLRIPVIEMVEIGAGGGSIARQDSMGRITVGPDSSGAKPGPVCYGLGGSEPTVTDANLILGRLDTGDFTLSGLSLDLPSTMSVLHQFGEKIGLSAEHAALGISEVVEENMSNAARVHAVESGKSIETRTLVAFGGAAPLHAARIADKLGIQRVIVPNGAGVGSALGFLRAPFSFEVARSHHQELVNFDPKATNTVLDAMRKEAESVVKSAAEGAPLIEERAAFMRYSGQGHEIRVPLTSRNYLKGDELVLQSEFEERYKELYRRIIPGAPVEVMSWVLTISTEVASFGSSVIAKEYLLAESVGMRDVVDPVSGSFEKIPIYQRHQLHDGSKVKGPAIIVESETSTMVGANFDARIDNLGNIDMNRKPSES